ncbi:MAG: hypothetical protein EHM55_24470 [Acidobacteria bacterium]|nr:MAG: hypothetical protein EHM55_24470 [Acidobacteriota bacterium]
MATTKLILGIGLALLIAVGVGWVWGASGRSSSDRALQIAELRTELLEGRAAVLDARLDIYSVNFGDASRHFEVARTALRAANAGLMSLGRTEDAKSLEAALTRIDEAQRLAGQLNQDANALAAEAAKTIGDVLGRIAKR